jgi:hypothetical protein
VETGGVSNRLLLMAGAVVIGAATAIVLYVILG